MFFNSMQPGKLSRVIPDTRMVTSIRGRPNSSREITSIPLTRPSESHTGRTPSRKNIWDYNTTIIKEGCVTIVTPDIPTWLIMLEYHPYIKAGDLKRVLQNKPDLHPMLFRPKFLYL